MVFDGIFSYYSFSRLFFLNNIREKLKRQYGWTLWILFSTLAAFIWVCMCVWWIIFPYCKWKLYIFREPIYVRIFIFFDFRVVWCGKRKCQIEKWHDIFFKIWLRLRLSSVYGILCGMGGNLYHLSAMSDIYEISMTSNFFSIFEVFLCKWMNPR